MEGQEILYTLNCDETVTLLLACLVLLLGHLGKHVAPILKKFFIPAPVVGGLIFAIIALIGHETNYFVFNFDSTLKNLLMTCFFTSVGFLASLRFLIKGGLAVAIFLGCALCLIAVQNAAGIGLASMFGLNPLIGIATGSVSLSGGHGTAGAFGPLLEDYGLDAGLSVSIAAATFGLVAGSMIGGPVGKLLVSRRMLHSGPKDHFKKNADAYEDDPKTVFDEHGLFQAVVYLVIAMGLGYFVILGCKKVGLTFPAYLGPMFIAAIIRNITDYTSRPIPVHTIGIVGSLSLQFFLAMALMTLKLWELAALAIPLVTILLTQTVIMALFAYFVTFKVMGSDYDAAVIACGHCGFGMGATPNAMANMETFTGANGPSDKAFFVVPLVGSLFIDFFNAFIITSFIHLLV